MGKIKLKKMKTELQEKLLNKYPEFFEHIRPLKIYTGKATMHQEVQELLKQKDVVYPLQFGIETQNGWYFLLDELMGSIQWHLKNVNERIDREPKYKLLDKLCFYFQNRTSAKRKLLRKVGNWLWDNQPRGGKPHIELHITQIKEKFSGLCFYTYGGDEAIHGMVDLAESMSYKTCEYCGTTSGVGRTKGWLSTICKDCREKILNRKDLEWDLIENLNENFLF